MALWLAGFDNSGGDYSHLGQTRESPHQHTTRYPLFNLSRNPRAFQHCLPWEIWSSKSPKARRSNTTFAVVFISKLSVFQFHFSGVLGLNQGMNVNWHWTDIQNTRVPALSVPFPSLLSLWLHHRTKPSWLCSFVPTDICCPRQQS